MGKLVTVSETHVFARQCETVLSDAERHALIDHLAQNPTAGAIMPRTSGCRKLRWATAGSGKTGGARVIYYFHDGSQPLFLLGIYAKSKQATLSRAQEQRLAKAVQVFKKGTDDG